MMLLLMKCRCQNAKLNTGVLRSPGRGFEAASPQICGGEGLPRFFPSPDPTHVRASGTGSALPLVIPCVSSSQVPGWSGLSNARVTIFGDVYPLPAELQVSFLVPFVVRYCNQLGN